MGGSARRVSLAYVELTASRSPHKNPHVSSAGHKENALARSSASQMNASTQSAPSKHRLDPDSLDVDQPPPKKPKQPMPALPLAPNASVEYPNGFVYCHQCNKKRDATIAVRCTAKDRRGHRCYAKYCKPCLKNRYGLQLEDILADDGTDAENDVHGVDYHFRCPRCNDACNCVACRKAKGLQPTGNLANAARQSGLTSAADVLRQDPKAAGSMANKPVEGKAKGAQGTNGKLESSNKSMSAPVKGGIKHSAQSSTSAPQPKAKPGPKGKGKAPSKPKLLAKPVWTSVGTTLSRAEAEERINIREFVLRFSSVLELSRSHLDELDEIRPSRTRNLEDEDEDFVPWVSETCVKSLILGILNMLDTKGDREKHLKATTKSIRESGALLNKIWAALATLRDWQENASTSSRSSSTSFPLTFPDPSPPPEFLSTIRTRSGGNQTTGGINVLRTSQLIPVVTALINAAVESEVVRRELEAGTQEFKDRVKEAREAHRVEQERIEKERNKLIGKRLDKPRFEHHKRIMAAIDDALKVASYATIPRLLPLGRDMEGRIYWALTPGMNEREDAVDLLQSYSQGRAHRLKSRRRPLVPSDEDRGALRKWPWFVAVWGTRPSIEERASSESDDDSEAEDHDHDDDEQWWGFWQPEEIMKLASWIHFKADLEDGSVSAPSGPRAGYFSDSDTDMDDGSDDERDDVPIPTKSEIATLVNELEQYASLLEGRIKRENEVEDNRSARK